MSRLTGTDILDLREAYKQMYSELEYNKLDEDLWNPSTWFDPSPQQNAAERTRLEQAQTAAAEKVDRTVGRAHQLPNSGTRYTVNLDPNRGQVIRRREGQVAQLGGRRVKWEVDAKGKGKWMPDQPEFSPNLQYLGTTGVRTVRINPNKDDMGRPIQSTRQTRPTKKPTSQGRPSISSPAVATTRPTTSPTSRGAIPSYAGATNVRPIQQANLRQVASQSPVLGYQLAQKGSNIGSNILQQRPSLAQQSAEDLRRMRQRSQERIAAQGRTPATPLVQSFDPFDIVMGHLIDEGFAENEEAAVVIMSNMSEEWIQSILEV